MNGLIFLCATVGDLVARESPWRLSDTTRLGRPFAKDPSVETFQGRTLLYYSIPGAGSDGWAIGIAEQQGDAHWKRVGEFRATTAAESKGVAAPFALVLGPTLHLFYQSYEGGPKDAICHATSTDGIHFAPDPANPIFRPKAGWCIGRAIDVEVTRWHGRWFLYFATRDPAYKIQQLGVATSEHGFSRDDWREASLDGPILKPELPWEGMCIEAPTLIDHENRLYMFYAGGYNNAPQMIGCAVSDDGLTWKRLSEAPLLANGPKGAWNSSESGHPGVFRAPSGEEWLYFQGNDDHGKTWWLSRKRIVWKNGRPTLHD